MNIITKNLNKTRYKQLREKNDRIRFIIIHHTGGSYTGDRLIFLWETSREVSIHYYIDKRWNIEHFVDDNFIAYHTWTTELIKTKTKWGFNLNPISIGIELENKWNNIDKYPKKQIQALEELTCFLAVKYEISPKNIIWHKEATLRKIDPSSLFYKWDMIWFRREMKKKIIKAQELKKGKKKYDWVKGIKIFNDMEDNYETKKLIEIWLLRYYRKQKHWLLKLRKD